MLGTLLYPTLQYPNPEPNPEPTPPRPTLQPNPDPLYLHIPYPHPIQPLPYSCPAIHRLTTPYHTLPLYM